jgi:hypothetical protein
MVESQFVPFLQTGDAAEESRGPHPASSASKTVGLSDAPDFGTSVASVPAPERAGDPGYVQPLLRVSDGCGHL